MSRPARIALKVGAWTACLAPLVALGYWIVTDNLTANPISFITNHLGDWTFRILLAALAMTPLRLVTGWGWPALLRRLLGLFAFFYAALHFSVWILIDHFFNWGQMVADIVKRPYITVGMLALTLMIPLATTSTAHMVRRLGARNWKRLHRLVYVVGICAALHFLWLAKVGRRDQYVHAGALALLLGVRAVDWARRAARRSRAPGSTLVPRALGLLAVVLLAGCAAAGGGRQDGAPARPTREVLPNGVVLIVQQHGASDVVALQLWLRVGGRDEAPEELGLSHYLEHMLFKGTPTRPPGSIDALIEGLGGQSNAYTSYDYTHYDVVVPAENLNSGVKLLADIAVNASFVQRELDAERKVVFEEMRLTEDNPDRFMLRRLYEVAYMPHPYGRPILGTPELIGALTRERLRAYYTKYYVPNDMVLVVVGAVRPEEARLAAGAAFARLTGPAAARPVSPPLPALDRGRRVDVPRTEEQAYLGMAWRTAPTNAPDVYAVDLLTYILGDGPSSRLNQTLREREHLVFNIDAGYGAWAEAGLVTVIARLDPATLERAEAAVLEVIRRVRADGVSEAERQRAIITAESNYAFDIETAEGLAKTYGQAETTWTLDNELAYLRRLRQVTAAEIQAVARKYFSDDDYARVRFLPRTAR